MYTGGTQQCQLAAKDLNANPNARHKEDAAPGGYKWQTLSLVYYIGLR